MSTAAQVPDFIPAGQPDFIPAPPEASQFEKDHAPGNREGFLRAAWNTVKGIPIGIGAAISDPRQAAVETGIRLAENDAHRKEEGRAKAYRAVAGAGDILGIDARGMEDAADRGDMPGVLGHAAGSAAPYVAPLAIEGATRGATAAARPVGRAITRAATAVDPDIVGIASPRLAHAQNLAIRTGKALSSAGQQTAIPTMDAMSAAVPNEVDALSEEASKPRIIHYPDQGFIPKGPSIFRENPVNSPPVKPTPPVIQTGRPMAELTGTFEPIEAPYRKGPGEVPPDIVGEPNRDILANGRGVIVRKPKLLKAAPSGGRPITLDAIDDAGINQEMAQNLEEHGRAALLDESREFAENNSADVPKWKRLAAFRAQMAAENVLKEAELARQIPERMTKTKGRAPARSIIPSATGDLTPILEESVRQALAKKGRPMGDK